MQMTRGMKIKEAKAYVADKLKVSIADLTDPVVMTEVRQDLQIGTMSPQAMDARGIDAKFRIADILDININCVERFKKRTAW